jgi:hypothetical protein
MVLVLATISRCCSLPSPAAAHLMILSISCRIEPLECYQSSISSLSLILLLVFFPSPALVHRPYSSEPCQQLQLLTCAGHLRMVFVVLGPAWWSNDEDLDEADLEDGWDYIYFINLTIVSTVYFNDIPI